MALNAVRLQLFAFQKRMLPELHVPVSLLNTISGNPLAIMTRRAAEMIAQQYLAMLGEFYTGWLVFKSGPVNPDMARNAPFYPLEWRIKVTPIKLG